MIALALSLAPAAQGAADEARYYTLDHLVAPEGVELEVGGMDFLPDGRLVLSTRRGELWLVEDALAEDPLAARFTRFAEGLCEGLGLAVVDGSIHVLERGQLARFADTDGDERCDLVETISDAWGLSGNYHEFAFGLPRDDAGNFYLGLNLGFVDPKWWHGKSLVPWRGWVLQVAPDGSTRPYACGFRSPCGLGRDALGRLLVTDNQGDWMPACGIFHLREEGFFGHPASLRWSAEYQASATLPSDTDPPARAREDAAIWLPYAWSRSTGNLVADPSGGRFGPFAGQLFVAEMTNGLVLRALLEDVEGEVQGACMPFRQGVGSAARVVFGPDGTLLVGLTNRGWGGLPPASGVARVRWTGELPMEVAAVRIRREGFELEFTRPLARGIALQPASVRMLEYDYDWWWEYGSPERNARSFAPSALALSTDRKTLALRTSELRPGTCVRIALQGIVGEGGHPLLHEELAYTIRRVPGDARRAYVAKLVPPPAGRERGAEGWLRLTYGDAFDAWRPSAWTLCEAELDRADPRRFATRAGNGALVNQGPERAGDFTSKAELGDCELALEFMLPVEGAFALALQGLHELRFEPDRPGEALRFGAVAQGAGLEPRPPARSAFRGPGLWHALSLSYEAPRFDASGRKTRNARFVRVLVDDVLLHENVELLGPAREVLGGERALGPLVVRGDLRPCALRGVRVRPRGAERGAEGWRSLLADDSLAGWSSAPEADVEIEAGELALRGPALLVSAERWSELELAARLKISDGGRAALLLGADESGHGGYRVWINASDADPRRTGSIEGLAEVRVQLVPPDTWVDLQVSCRDEPAGTRIQVRLQGVLVNEALDPERRATAGRIALEQQHENSGLVLRDLRIRAQGR